jgi:hypothetical protein
LKPSRTYRPLRDPAFLVACCAYVIGRVFLRREGAPSFASAHLNDLLCIPIWTPVMVACLDRLQLRCRGEPPAAAEVLLPLIVLAVTFEIVLPSAAWFESFSYRDPRDVTWYTVGAVLASLWWRAAYPDRFDDAASAT